MKLVLKLLAVALLGFVLLVVAASFLVPPAARRAVEVGSTHAFGVPTTLDDLGADLGLRTSGLTLEGYRVGGPEGFEDAPLLEVDRFDVSVGTTSLVGEPKRVEAIVLEDLHLRVVQRGAEGNLWPVWNRIREIASGGDDAPPAEDGGTSPGPRLSVGRVRIAGVRATFELGGVPGLETLERTFELPDYDEDWTALTGDEGMTVAELSARVVDDLVEEALAKADEELPPAAAQVLRAAAEGSLEGGLSGALDALKGEAEDRARDELDELRDGARDELEEKLDDGLKELIGGGGR